MRKSLYLLPNLFTSANLLFGFLSMIAASNGQYSQAALAILVAVGLDAVDGKVARMTNSASAFGLEYDSLADLLSFGDGARVAAVQLVPQLAGPVRRAGGLPFRCLRRPPPGALQRSGDARSAIRFHRPAHPGGRLRGGRGHAARP